jgi:hypothetical protein
MHNNKAVIYKKKLRRPCFFAVFRISESGSGSRISSEPGYGSGSGSRAFMAKNLKNYTADFFSSKVAITLSPGLHSGRPSYRSSLQLPPSKENNEHFKDEIY